MESSAQQEVDALIVGAGFAGLVTAERLSNELGWTCVVVEQRDHIGGNAYDYYDDAGVLVHKYGPHYFRSNSEKIVEYLSQFTDWHPVEYRVKSYTEGRYWNFPINLNTFEQLIDRASDAEEFRQWMEDTREKIDDPKNSEEVITSQVGKDLYEKFFKGYTIKQWKKHPRDLDPSVCGRIPIRTNRDDRYLRESFQALPADGYTALFENMVAATPGLELRLGTSLDQAKEQFRWKHLVYTGPIDAYFDHCHGPLPYRSLKFQHQSFNAEQLRDREAIAGKPGHWQPEMQVNYPSTEVDFTRIVEIKHATGQDTSNSTIVKEFPADFEETGEPYYPVPTDDSKALYQQYKTLAEAEPNTSFIGRLGTYKYYNMDQVVGMALKEAEKICKTYA
ncbi:UDP-galactopyranose mutase [Verrucomicrobiaceae bacterium R5-34]|nr:UDP-galactopyranose mutase [Verrucomicrobiaceae bacterium R5-34]